MCIFSYATPLFCAKMVTALDDNLINCLHLMILQDIHTNKPVKFSNHYLNTVTEVRDGQDGSQTSFGEISFFPRHL